MDIYRQSGCQRALPSLPFVQIRRLSLAPHRSHPSETLISLSPSHTHTLCFFKLGGLWFTTSPGLNGSELQPAGGSSQRMPRLAWPWVARTILPDSQISSTRPCQRPFRHASFFHSRPEFSWRSSLLLPESSGAAGRNGRWPSSLSRSR